MATIDYSRRSAKLGNLGETKKVMPTVIPDFMSGVDRTHAWERAYARQGRGWEMAADGAVKLGQAIIGLDAMLQSRENERLVSKAAGMVMNIHDGNLTNPEKDDEGLAIGLLNRSGEACLNLPQEGHESLTRTLNAVSEELELSDKQIEMLKEKLSPYAMSCMGRLRARQQSEIGRIQVEDAKALYEADVRTISDGNGSDEMYETALKDYDSFLALSGVSGKSREFARGTFVRTLFAANVKQTVSELKSGEDFDAAIDAAEKRPESLFMGNEVLKREMGGEVGRDLHAQLLKDMRAERDRFLGRERHEKMLLAEKVKGEFVNRELELMGKDMPETEWVSFYRECGEDEKLQAASPETALQYMKAADRLEKTIKKGVCDQTEDSLSLRMTNLMVREANGDQGLQGNQIATEQAAIWRDYQAALHSGKLSEGFANSFLNRIRNRLTDQERSAMREFYASFGWGGDLNREGEPSSKDRKDWAKERVLAPVDETQPLTGDVASGRKLTGAQMFELGDTFLRQLQSMGPDAYRPEVMKTVIGEIKTRHMASDFSRNRDELAWKMQNVQRGISAQMQTQGSEAKPREREPSDDGEDDPEGLRADGTVKGSGWLGQLDLKGGGYATEYSVGVEFDGKETEIPTLVPTLTEEERRLMTEEIIPNNRPVPDSILRKAVEHAKLQISQGKSPFKEDGKWRRD